MSILLLDQQKIIPPPSLVMPIDKREACHYQGRQGREILSIVEHIGVAPTFSSLVNYLAGCNDRDVSSTFVIGGDYVGQWALLVGSGPDIRYASGKRPLEVEALLRAANHAGRQTFPNTNPRPELGNPNWWTIGKEHVGYPGQVWTEIMIQNDIDCNRYIRAVLGTKPFTYILGHFNFDPKDRANCPGPSFPWNRIYGMPQRLHLAERKAHKEIPLDELHALPIGDLDAYAELAKEYQ